MKKIDTFVANIAQQLVDKLNKAEYDIDRDEFGLSITADAHVDLEDKCRVEAYFYWKYDEKGVEVNLYPENKERDYFTLQDAISEKVNELLDPDEFKEEVLTLEREAEMDVYERNGFASASDYYSWRYR